MKVGKRRWDKQSLHDEAVIDRADHYYKKGCNVKADVPGLILGNKQMPKIIRRPELINDHRPDVIAKCSDKLFIEEVETKNTLKRDKKQHEAFKKYVKNEPNKKFNIVVADE